MKLTITISPLLSYGLIDVFFRCLYFLLGMNMSRGVGDPQAKDGDSLLVIMDIRINIVCLSPFSPLLYLTLFSIFVWPM